MKKAIIVGCPGSGKSTFAKALAKKTGLPLIHLDKIRHLENWQAVSDDEFDEKLKTVLESEQWIIDGNYNRTIKWRLQYCDTVFYLDFPFILCLWSVIKRTFQNYGKVRDDMGENCVEKFDRQKIEFYWFIINFNRKHRKKYLKILENVEGVDVVIFKSRKEIDEYLENRKQI